MRRIFVRFASALAIVGLVASPAFAGKSPTEINAEIDANFADNKQGLITEAILRATLKDIAAAQTSLYYLVSTCAANQWVNGFAVTGAPTCARPAFSNLSGSISAGQMIAPGVGTLGGVYSSAAGANQFATGIDTTGAVVYQQPSFSNLSGQIAASQLIAPGASTFGAVKSSSAGANQFATGINTSGVVTYAAIGTGAMPAFTGGDCTTSAGSVALNCTKTGGVSFAPSATTDTTKVYNVTNATPRVETNAALSALPSTYSTSIVRVGYAAAGDAPPVVYTPSGSACSLNAGAGDGASQVPTSDSKCWIGKIPEPVDVRIFGAKGDGSTDDGAAISAAATYGKDILLPPGRTYLLSRPITLGSGQNLFGYGAVLKRAAQISTTTTTSINPSVFTITVANPSGFAIGQQIAILNGATSSLNVPITGISGNNITVGTTFGVTVSGTTTVYLSFYTIISNGGKVVGVEIDGNASNYSFYRWQNTIEIQSTGSHNVVENCYIHDAPGEAIEESVAANIPTSIGNRYVKNIIKTTNGNGIHLSGSIGALIEGNHIESTNLQGPTMGHNGGNITFSSQIRDARIINNYLASGRAGVGQCYDTNCVGARIEGNIIRNASTYAVEVIAGTNNTNFLNVTFRNNKVYDSATATFTFTQSDSTVTPTGTVASGSNTITAVSSLTNVGAGASISGTGIPANSIVIGTDGVNKIYLGNRSGASVNATSSGSGVTLTITGQVPFNLSITDNLFVKTLVAINNVSGLQVENNTFDYNVGDTANVALSLSKLIDATVVGNNFRNVGLAVYASDTLTNVLIANNTATKWYANAFYLDAGTYANVIVSGNVIANDSTASASAIGVILNGLTSVIGNSIVLNKGTAGVAINVNDTFVSNNYISKGAATNSVLIYGGTSNSVVVNNKLNGAAVQDNGTGDTVTPNY